MTDMLAEAKHFSWLERVSQDKREEFWKDWHLVLCEANVIGMGCVVDRPGYVNRGYLEKYKQNRWLLCRSAFDITVERAVKLAKIEGKKLHVVFESDPGVNRIVTDYFTNLRTNGLAFDQNNSKKYKPLLKDDFETTLGRVAHKPKDHPILQIADSYIYAISRSGYDKKFTTYRILRDRQKIVNFCVPNDLIPEVGIKYYCFDKQKSRA
jgi:hypothetical protein